MIFSVEMFCKAEIPNSSKNQQIISSLREAFGGCDFFPGRRYYVLTEWMCCIYSFFVSLLDKSNENQFALN